MNILIIRLGHIGDVVHTLPALAALKRTVPAARVAWAVERGASAEILRSNPLIDRLIEIDTQSVRRAGGMRARLKMLREQLRLVRAEPFDLAIDFQGLLKSALVARASGARRRVGFDKHSLREPPSRFLLTETVKVPARTHIISKNLTLLAGALGDKTLSHRLVNERFDLEFPIGTTTQDEREAQEIIEALGGKSNGDGFAILNPGGGWQTKLWGAENFGRLADQIFRRYDLPSLITFGPGEEDLAARTVAASETKMAHAVSPSLKSFYCLAKRARLYVGGDTGPTHLAVAACAPVVGIFGPTEWWRNGSPRADDLCVERQDATCRTDCHRRVCDNWVCLNIEVSTVFEAVCERLRRAQSVAEANTF